MACGCVDAGCACVVQGAGGITVTGSGTSANPYIVSGAAAGATFAAVSANGGIAITPGGPQGHTPTFALVLDPASPAPLSVSGAGLSVACCGGGATTLDSLTDVDTLGAVVGSIIRYDGVNWTVPAGIFFTPDGYLQYDNGVIYVGPDTAGGQQAFTIFPAGSAGDTFRIFDDGAVWWGDTALAAPDTNLYRTAPDVLHTDDSFDVGVDLTVGGATTLSGVTINALATFNAVVDFVAGVQFQSLVSFIATSILSIQGGLQRPGTLFTTGVHALTALDSYVIADTSTGVFTFDLPATPANGTEIRFKDGTGQASANNITINPQGGDQIDQAGVLVFSNDWQSATLTYQDALNQWLVSWMAYNEESNPQTIGSVAINDLSDVSTAGAAVGSVLRYDGVNWTIAPGILINNGSGSFFNSPVTVNDVLLTNASVRHASNTYNSNQSISAGNDNIIFADASGGPLIFTLPAVAGAGTSYRFIFKDTGFATGINTVTISGGAGTIDGAAAQVISTAYGTISVVQFGSDWLMV